MISVKNWDTLRNHQTLVKLVAVLILAILSGEAYSAGFQGSVAYISNNTTELHIKDLPGGTDSLVSFDPPFAYIDTPQWSSDGQRITFSAKYAGGGMQVYVSRPDGTELQRITDGTGTWSMPSFSPDGNKVVYHGSYDGQMFVYDRDTSASVPVGTGMYTRWSPVDSNTIAYSDGGDIFLLNLSTSVSTPVTPHETGQVFNHIAWSPDGTHLALSGITDGLYDVWLVGSGGSGLINRTSVYWPDPIQSYYPSWSPDGQYIVFQSAMTGDLPDLWSMSYADPSIRVNLTNTPTVGEFSPAVTPEPATLTLLVLGGAALAARRRKG